MENLKTQIVDEQRRNADILYPKVLQKIRGTADAGKKVVAISGGSGVGKTGMAWLLKERLEADGIPALIVSGDNYPHRIPMYNDAERLRLFRAAGLKGLMEENAYDAAVWEELRELQMQGQDSVDLQGQDAAELQAQEQDTAKLQGQNQDSDEDFQQKYPWLSIYQRWGDAALEEYLGTENELLFSEVSSVLSAFKKGEKTLMLRRMGREAHEVWYEETESGSKEVLILEWTHGNSPLLAGVDVSIVLKSTPEETLENRKKRNRDAAVTSPFVARVLRIEQGKIDDGLGRADLIQDMKGNLVRG